MTNIPSDKARTMVGEIDQLIVLADNYEDFVLGALLCAVRDHLEPVTEDRALPES